MASSNNPTSSAELIRKYSKARVINASSKRFVTRTDALTGLPLEFSRAMTDSDAVESLVKKYS